MKKVNILCAANNDIGNKNYYTVTSFQGALPTFTDTFPLTWIEYSAENTVDLAKKVAVASVLTSCALFQEDEEKILELVDKINKL